MPILSFKTSNLYILETSLFELIPIYRTQLLQRSFLFIFFYLLFYYFFSWQWLGLIFFFMLLNVIWQTRRHVAWLTSAHRFIYTYMYIYIRDWNILLMHGPLVVQLSACRVFSWKSGHHIYMQRVWKLVHFNISVSVYLNLCSHTLMYECSYHNACVVGYTLKCHL